jgi:hypothetical protein
MIPIVNGTGFVFQLPGTEVFCMAGYDGRGAYAARLAKSIDLWKLRSPEGEHAFLESLKPRALAQYADQFKVEIDRQGDLHVARLAIEKSGLIDCLSGYGHINGFDRYHVQQANCQKLLGTDHTLLGIRWLSRTREGKIHLFGDRAELVSGFISAPDHDTITLEGPHLVMLSEAFIRG